MMLFCPLCKKELKKIRTHIKEFHCDTCDIKLYSSNGTLVIRARKIYACRFCHKLCSEMRWYNTMIRDPIQEYWKCNTCRTLHRFRNSKYCSINQSEIYTKIKDKHYMLNVDNLNNNIEINEIEFWDEYYPDPDFPRDPCDHIDMDCDCGRDIKFIIKLVDVNVITPQNVNEKLKLYLTFI